MITLRALTKRFGAATAVDDLTVEIGPGQVTGFLGPNGAGKSTTMRMVLGLDRPTAGQALVNGRPYRQLRYPLHEVGALLDATGVHPARSGRAHLRAMARSNGIPARRVDEVLDLVGLDERAADKPGRALSLGMGQRLGIAGALLGDPPVLLLDEPVNGLDPDGVRWIRRFTRGLADEGRTVLISSHLMSEMQQTADRVVVLGRGRLVADAPLADLIAARPASSVRVRGPESAGLATLGARLAAEGATVSPDDGGLTVTGVPAGRVGDLAYELRVRLHELTPVAASLEEAFLELTAGSVEFAAGPTGGEIR
ncbi:ATP-binding cassette domain-containing protein [Micromonospora halotolerans]|uniref:ATP-binding cassette domain-containing protein n=1 Tax=Micromonospora halotolerans TaxID=709879 RepID=A0ABZ0A0H3_9ACTN|nr:ATP-binding cassette domain-containing protein [Micromonospora halotolerans]WNM40320.1 ATP-binding cassette domain-containing protein [Micromonospora halotolerans]